ncbi:MAG: hypothetical protein AseanaTS_21410 [Candidatus Pelagadaptatus aseana]|uniref:chemotaxis protein CheW n=1 Tax=Candidatus Pelagadaptatus aseana TaxID=3120508 RepID=UPI0039B27E40
MTSETPQDSLQHYFDDLLLDSSVNAAEEPRPQPKKIEEPKADPPELSFQEKQRDKEVQAKAKLARLLSSAPVQTKTQTETRPVVDAYVKEAVTEIEPTVAVEEIVEVEQSVEVEADSVPEEELMQSLAWLDNGRPRWAQERFDVLLFSVSGLTLAVPLIALGQIQPLTDELTPLFGQADWFMGLQPTPMGKIRTVNTAKFVMPERYDDAFLESAKYVVSIDGLPWGLAVDEVNQPITLEPEDVKWRGERSKRAWLAGTVKQHMCALIDIPMMGQLLENEDHAKKI